MAPKSPTLVQEAAKAALEVLGGQPDVSRVLEIADHLAVAKHLLRKLAAGDLVLTPPAAEPPERPKAQELSGAVPIAVALGMMEDRD